MRPDPQQSRNNSEYGQIIYLGDVRKRRGTRRQTPDRYYLAALMLVAVLCWAAWLTVVMSLAPSRLLSYVAFFVPLSLALWATSSLAYYGVDSRWGDFPRLEVSVRRGGLIAGCVTVDLACLAAHAWLPPVFVGTIAAAVLIELGLRSR